MPSETLISHFKPSSSPLNSSKPLNLPPPPLPDHPTAVQSMFLSVQTSSKSSNWLHRLRSSRGFPESDHIDLEHFLSASKVQIDPTDSASTSNRPPPEENSVAGKCDDDNGALQGRDLINNVLSELFYMGECEDQSRIKRKKSCRKQPCPRIHVVSTNSDVGNVKEVTGRKNMPASRSSLPLTSISRHRVKEVTGRKDMLASRSSLPLTSSSRHRVKEVSQVRECVDDEEENTRCDLSAYSQTEVTVIDTSVPCWKFEKVLYRRKNVWKVGDKKGKGLMNGDRKKMKDRLKETGGDVPKKKLKKKLKLCNSSKYADKEGSMGHDRSKMIAGNEKKWDTCSQLQEKSVCRKQIEEGSSVILIKSIPTTNKKNVSVVSNSCVKSI